MLQKIVASMTECFASYHLFQKGPNFLSGIIYMQKSKGQGKLTEEKKEGKGSRGLGGGESSYHIYTNLRSRTSCHQ